MRNEEWELKRWRVTIMVTMMTTLLASCDFVTSDNGDLDGLWQMTVKEHVRSSEVTDMRARRVSWAFQGGLVQMNSEQIEEVTGQFTLTDDVLRVTNLNHFTHTDGDSRIDSVDDVMRELGVYRLEETYEVKELNKNTLRLQNDSVRLVFRKY